MCMNIPVSATWLYPMLARADHLKKFLKHRILVDCTNNWKKRRSLHVGISLGFMTDLFREWLKERDMRHLANALKRAAIDDQLVVRFEMRLKCLECLVAIQSCFHGLHFDRRIWDRNHLQMKYTDNQRLLVSAPGGIQLTSAHNELWRHNVFDIMTSLMRFSLWKFWIAENRPADHVCPADTN